MTTQTRYLTGGDECLGFWKETWEAGLVDLPLHAEVLEVGCAEADWQTPMLAVRPDLRITGIDVRTQFKLPCKLYVADVLTHDFHPEEFDAIVAVSTIEHIGLGAYDKDLVDEDGDRQAMARLARWLKPGGWMYLDVPYRPRGPYQNYGKFRAYDDEALQTRLIEPSGLHLRSRRQFPADHPDGPYIALVLEKVA